MRKIYAIALACLLGGVSASAADGWDNLGTGEMTDFVLTAFGLQPVKMQVEIQRNSYNPDVYRVLTPYATYPNPNVAEFAYSPALADPMVIHVVDGGYFYFEDFSTGYSYLGGEVMAINNAYHFLEDFSVATIIDVLPGCLGVFDGKEFTYGATFSFNGDEGYTLNMGWMYSEYGCNIKGEYRVVLPVATEVNAAVVTGSSATDDVEYYRLDGRRVTAPMPGQLLLRRQGTEVTRYIAR